MSEAPVFSVDNLFFNSPQRGRLPITDLFDTNGIRVSDPEFAAKCVCALPEGRYLVSSCYPHEIERGTKQ